jgi:hypothetical protein
MLVLPVLRMVSPRHTIQLKIYDFVPRLVEFRISLSLTTCTSTCEHRTGARHDDTAADERLLRWNLLPIVATPRTGGTDSGVCT